MWLGRRWGRENSGVDVWVGKGKYIGTTHSRMAFKAPPAANTLCIQPEIPYNRSRSLNSKLNVMLAGRIAPFVAVPAVGFMLGTTPDNRHRVNDAWTRGIDEVCRAVDQGEFMGVTAGYLYYIRRLI
jgi:hypothetical protein